MSQSHTIENFEQFASATLQNHLDELNTRYENESMASYELKKESYLQHQEIFRRELDEQLSSLAFDKNEEELQNIKQGFLSRLELTQ